MKVFKFLAVLATGAVLSVSSTFAGAEGSGTRGGGHVIDVDSTPYLMDLVTKAVCEWKEGSEFVKELPSLRVTLDKLARLDWYFARDLEKEIGELNFCLTGPLYKIPAHEYYSVARRPRGEETRQAAYRLYGDAFIDADIFEKMNGTNKAMLIIHETMHSYLRMGMYDRALKLRSMVKVIDQVRKGEIMSRKKLHYSMEMNEISFPQTVEALDKNKEAVLFLTGSLRERIQMIQKVLKPETLMDLGNSFDLLAPWDQQLIGVNGKLGIFTEALSALVQNSTPGEIAKILDKKEFVNINPAGLVITELEMLNQEQKNAVLKSMSFSRLLTDGFNELLEAKVSYGDYLILASKELQEMASLNSEKEVTPLVSLKPVKTLPLKLAWLANTMLILEGEKSLEMITKNEDFYTALGLKNQKRQVQELALKIERERSVALESLDILSASLLKALEEALKTRSDEVTVNKIMKQINVNNF